MASVFDSPMNRGFDWPLTILESPLVSNNCRQFWHDVWDVWGRGMFAMFGVRGKTPPSGHHHPAGLSVLVHA